MALTEHDNPTPHELINTARGYTVNSPARLAYLAESAAVSLAILAEQATTREPSDSPDTAPSPVKAEATVEPATAPEVNPETPGDELAPDASPSTPPQPKRARRTRATSPVSPETNAA